VNATAGNATAGNATAGNAIAGNATAGNAAQRGGCVSVVGGTEPRGVEDSLLRPPIALFPRALEVRR
jgi:hypothetical protein